MRFFLDHDVPVDIGRTLRLAGHMAEFLDKVLPKTSSDLDVFRYAVTREMVVITYNRHDFLQLAKTEPHVGLII